MGSGLLPLISTGAAVVVDTAGTGFLPDSGTDARLVVSYQNVLPNNRLRPGYPDDITIFFYDTVVDTSLAVPFYPATPARFEIIAHTAEGDRRLDFRFRDRDGNGTLSRSDEIIDAVTYIDQPARRAPVHLALPAGGAAVPTRFADPGRRLRPGAAAAVRRRRRVPLLDPGRVRRRRRRRPDPGALRGAQSLHGVGQLRARALRRLRARRAAPRVPRAAGPLHRSASSTCWASWCRPCEHDGSNDGFVAWDLRTKDDLDVAPGLYIFQVEGGPAGKSTGKFAIVK